MQPDALEPLRRAVRAAEGDFDAETCQWLQEGVSRWLNASEPISLEECLRLASSRGEPTVRQVLARARRDHWLQVAWRAVSDDATLTSWRRSVLLASEIDRFETRGVWRRLLQSTHPLEGLSELRTALFQVFSSGAHVPRSARQIDAIVKSGRGSDFTDGVVQCAGGQAPDSVD